MGKKSKKKKAGAAAPRQIEESATSSTGAPTNSTPGAASTVDFEPIVDFDLDVWEARFPFAEKTPDPDAENLDKAHHHFLEGIRLASNNDMAMAMEYIAAAYLRDFRVFVIYQEPRNRALDAELFIKMLKYGMSDTGPRTLSMGILFMIQSLSPLIHSSELDTVGAMKALSTMIDLGPNFNLETSTLGILGGLTHAQLYYWRGRLYDNMLNGKAALRDYSKALKLDPSLHVARMVRIEFWRETGMKTQAELHAECIAFLDLAHEDYSELDVIYALLARTTLRDPRLGTYDASTEYYKKSLEATSRRAELYGPREGPNKIIRQVRMEMQWIYEHPECDASKTRKRTDATVLAASSQGIKVCDFLDQDDGYNNNGKTKAKRNRCLNCKKHEGDQGIQLRKCSRCRSVYYCSTECIRANWKEHKDFCNEISGHYPGYKAPIVKSAPVALDKDKV